MVLTLRCSRSAISAVFTPWPIRRKTSSSRSASASSGERVTFFAPAADGAMQHRLDHRVTQVDLAFQHPPDAFDDLVRGLILIDVTQRTGAERTLGVERFAVHRPDQHADAVVAVLDPLDQVDAAAGLERDIDDGHVGLGVGDQAQGLAHVGGLATDFQVGLPADPHRQRLAHGRVVIDDQDPGSFLGCCYGSWFFLAKVHVTMVPVGSCRLDGQSRTDDRGTVPHDAQAQSAVVLGRLVWHADAVVLHAQDQE